METSLRHNWLKLRFGFIEQYDAKLYFDSEKSTAEFLQLVFEQMCSDDEFDDNLLKQALLGLHAPFYKQVRFIDM
jgi:hypothetical protein